jgi:hypothetical protein
VAGIVWNAHPKCTNAEIRAALQKSAQDMPPALGRDEYTGFGLVDAAPALAYLAKNKCKAYLPPSPPPKKVLPPPKKLLSPPPKKPASKPVPVWGQCGGKGGDCGKVPGLVCRDAAVLRECTDQPACCYSGG